ncbi:hypothetical protein [Streptomyces sp. bgisy095]|uniref:hypothetical protein n=1 Tax=unclassified Streptomyces TaxID=2593676 RepID=UPI003D7535D6
MTEERPDHEEYAATLPKAVVSAAVFFTDEQHRQRGKSQRQRSSIRGPYGLRRAEVRRTQ